MVEGNIHKAKVTRAALRGCLPRVRRFRLMDGARDLPADGGPVVQGCGMIRTAIHSILCVLVILVAVPQVTQAKDSLYEQKMARGILAFESGEFPTAAAEFQAALSEKPDDPAATLYLGIAQSRSGDPQAESTLKKAVRLNPKDARANFELGVLYYQRNILEEANDYFDTAASLSPGSEIASQAQEFRKAADVRKSAGAKPWWVSAGLSGEYDSNVVIAPSGAPLPQGISRKSDYSAVALFDARYRFLSGPKGDLSAGYGFYRSWHRELTQFDVIRHAVALRGGIPVSPIVRLEIAYGFEYVEVSSEMFDRAHGLVAVVTVREGKDYATSLRYQYRNSIFGASELFPTNPDRDGDNQLIGVLQRASIGKNLPASAGYAHDEDRAVTPWWNAKGDKGFLAIGSYLPYRTSLRFYGEYYRKEYGAVDPQFTVIRVDETTTLSAAAGISFTDRYDLSVGYVYVKNDSTIPELAYTRSITSATLKARF